MFHESDLVVLTHDIHDKGLKEGDVGVIVGSYKNGKAFEVEFVNADSETIAVLTLNDKDIRPMVHKEIFHVREIKLVANA